MPKIGIPPELNRPSPANRATIKRPSAPAPGELGEKDKEKLLDKLSSRGREELYSKGKHNELGKDEFLKLLTHQLQNQDPLNPMEQNKFAGELAQFSQLEQLTNLNEKFDQFNKDPELLRKTQGASFLGKKVVTSGNSTFFGGEGKDADILFSLEEPAKDVMIRILDDKNNISGEIWKKNLSKGPQLISWDGERPDGVLAKEGNYKVVVKAWDEMSGEVDVESQQEGIVESVSFDDGEMILGIDGKKVYLRDVAQFSLPKSGISKERANTIALPEKIEAAPSIGSGPNREKGLKNYQSMRSVYD